MAEEKLPLEAPSVSIALLLLVCIMYLLVSPFPVQFYVILVFVY